MSRDIAWMIFLFLFFGLPVHAGTPPLMEAIVRVLMKLAQ